ncbi:4-hydroxy-tetrahydrodipicolinate synthase [Paraburkholderia kirstenboschensis]|uniref:4-hydroxy-tetrahydrodipicolinate synthase n=1 Tax=Paraburkholderia kirstenboschensis TaxID=1245436 RepID=A0ABZ0EID1_9BURK|nr:4-hydroxy-tetrahydrodipicolinate synthase [Paraburkholderia kirstenboschensis]WOD15893.1 4-hydroxy-tetrahydrodipicolinate synthase [Paraburkholderia kirstenboschensis]
MISGIWIPLVTPFRSGHVDLDALRTLADSYVAQGASGIVALGTTAEAALLTDSERDVVLKTIIETTAGRLPVIVGVGGLDTRAFQREITRLESLNVTGYLVSAPAYICPDQAGLKWHFDKIAASTERPLVLYNVPHRTGVSIEPETVRHLTAHRHIVAIKECAPEHFDQLRKLPIDVLCGTDEAFYDALKAGATGGILASAHVCTPLFVRILRLFASGRRTAARELFANLQPVIRTVFGAPNPSAIKVMLAYEGVIRPDVRAPIMPVKAELEARLRDAHLLLQRLKADEIGNLNVDAVVREHAL